MLKNTGSIDQNDVFLKELSASQAATPVNPRLSGWEGEERKLFASTLTRSL